MDTNLINTIRLSGFDNVVIARTDLAIGTMVDDTQVFTTEFIGAGHKIATELIPKGSVIRKYLLQNKQYFMIQSLYIHLFYFQLFSPLGNKIGKSEIYIKNE